RIRIDQRRWTRTLAPRLEQIGRDLGIPRGSRLKAELYDMLVYGPGQFFVSHRDTEKTDDMIGTMVVTLPSVFKGGTTVIAHHDEKATYRTASRGLTFVAFYADCHHQVTPITAGHRVVLTYNLSLVSDGSEVAPDAASETTPVLADGIRSYFETPRRPRWSGDSARELPDRLVYLLDHQYTQKGLAWHRLKSVDAARAGTLRAAAERLDCGIALALADVHETWSCEDEYGGRWRRYRDYDDELEDEDPEDPTLVDLVDSEIELRHWIDLEGRSSLPISSPIGTEEVCYTKPSSDLEPFASEHEGYMGNYGNTVDRWYHRAAIVLWPRERTFVIRAKASASWAIRQLGKTLKTSSLDEGRSTAAQLLPFWESVARPEQSRGFVDKTLRVAEAIQLPELASSLLKPFTLEQMSPRTAPLWARLLERYGGKWCQALLAHNASNHEGPGRKAWLLSLPGFCEALCSAGSPGAIELARWLTNEQWRRVVDESTTCREGLPGKYATDKLLRLHKPILRLLECSVIAEDPTLKREILEFPASPELTAAELDLLVLLLRAAAADRRPGLLAALGLESVHERCTRALKARLDDPPRAADDWSMPAPPGCTCGLCRTLGSFLVARDRNRFEWPLAKPGRSHVHRKLDRYDLPVTHETRRSGSPYTLVLTKTKALFERERAKRKAWESDLDWLNKERRRFLIAFIKTIRSASAIRSSEIRSRMRSTHVALGEE
ncbi:MAG: 2OG-Fe(II) oxygenase, partial [Vicinamibacteria bacterium]